MGNIIYHLAEPSDAAKLTNSRTYSAPSLSSEGFIHCASDEQLPGVIQRYYHNAQQQVLLHIDADQLGTDLVMENTVGGTELFPHVYAAINAAAIVKTQDLDSAKLQLIAQSERFDESLV